MKEENEIKAHKRQGKNLATGNFHTNEKDISLLDCIFCFFLFFFYKTQCHPSLKTTDWEREHLEWKSHFAWLPSDPLLCLLPCSDPIYRLLAIGPDAITTNIAMACFWLICRLENPIVSIFYGSASKKKGIKIEIFLEKTLHGI